MSYDEFLTRVIDEGIAAARESYKDDPEKLSGAVDGFEACRSRSPIQLALLLSIARKGVHFACIHGSKESLNEYWRAICYEREVEWVCNVVSAVHVLAVGEARPENLYIITPSARGVIKAAAILGVDVIVDLEKALDEPTLADDTVKSGWNRWTPAGTEDNEPSDPN